MKYNIKSLLIPFFILCSYLASGQTTFPNITNPQGNTSTNNIVAGAWTPNMGLGTKNWVDTLTVNLQQYIKYTPGIIIRCGSKLYMRNSAATGWIDLIGTGSGTVSGSGTLNYVPKWTNGTTLGNSLLTDDGTNVAITSGGLVLPNLQYNSTATTNFWKFANGTRFFTMRDDTTWKTTPSSIEGGSYFLGRNAGNTTFSGGGANIAIGDSASNSITTAFSNISIGSKSGLKATIGGANIGIGYAALKNNDTACCNIAIGYTAMTKNLSRYNVAIGHNAMTENTSGYQNVAIGYRSMWKNTTGVSNNAMGSGTLYANTTGGGNIGIGNDALRINTTGNNNCVVGTNSSKNNVTGNNNTALGTYALFANPYSGNIAIGNYAGANAADSNKLWIDNSNSTKDYAIIYGEMSGIQNSLTGQKLKINGQTYLNGISSGASTDSIMTWNAATTEVRKIPASAISGTISGLTTNYVTKATSATSIGNSQIFDNGTSVGIGTASLGTATIFNVNGASLFSGDNTTDPGDGTPAGVRVGFNVAGNYGYVSAIHTGISYKNLSLNKDGGNVGIGTASPGTALEVKIAGTANTVTDQITISNGLTGAATGTGGSGILYRSNNGSALSRIYFVGENLLNNEAAILFQTQTSSGTGLIDRVKISSTGNVGIGTTTPDSTLTVIGSGRFSKDMLINGLTVGRGGGNIGTNTANGLGALFSNTTGNNNTASGLNSLFSNTTGNNNTANGLQSLNNNTTGYNNTASGLNSLYSNTTGYNNTAYGLQSLFANTTGNFNAASGMYGLYSNTTGSLNTANGNSALYANTTGGYNAASGFYALFANTTGSYNTASGVQALLSNTTGNNNTASGLNSLYSNTTGSSNVANGMQALYANTTGFNNTAIGFGADVSSGALSNATAIGYNAIVGASNSLVLGGTGANAVNVGIGTASPGVKLDVTDNQGGVADVLRFYNSNTTPGSTGRVNVGAFNGAGGLFLEQSSNGTGPAAWASGSYDAFIHTAQAGSKLHFAANGSASPHVTINESGNLGIGTTTSAYKLTVVDASADGVAGRFSQGSSSGSPFGIYVSAVGSSTQNIAGYFSALNATSNYGVFIDGTPASTNNYALFSNSVAKSYFAGNVGIGTTTPNTKLEVAGAVTYSTTATPADPASGSTVQWFDGTNMKWKKNIAGVVTTGTIY